MNIEHIRHLSKMIDTVEESERALCYAQNDRMVCEVISKMSPDDRMRMFQTYHHGEIEFWKGLLEREGVDI